MIKTEGNTLLFSGSSSLSDLHRPLAMMHNLVSKQGYQDITLDFSAATVLSASFMLPLVCILRSYRLNKVDLYLVLPTDDKLARLFNNANWAHQIDPQHFDPRDEFNQNHVSAIQFRDADEQQAAVDKVVNLILEFMPHLDRRKIAALEWAINEITDNVLNHSESRIGGLVQAIMYPKRQLIEFLVCDAGIGIPNSLRKGRADVRDDTMALDLAIREGVTRNTKTNQGNGLFGTFRCSEVSGGKFNICSGFAMLSFDDSLHVKREGIPFQGTFVRSEIKLSIEDLLNKALVFKGKVHEPGFDFIERQYEQRGEALQFSLLSEVATFGSREAGRRAFNKIMNISNDLSRPINFDFSDVPVISSSFADEVFGRIFTQVGPVAFSTHCTFSNISTTVKNIIDKSVLQRIRQNQ
jgi:hypothetical protein